jgi:DNA-binding LacI/PurR family transcriptional regulator
MAVTIKDLARQLNISVSTVSYALNGGPRSVPEDVRQRVLDLAKELCYRPNRIARSLVTRRSHTIGVVPTEASINLAVTPYFQGVLNGILNTAEILEHDVLIYTRYDVKRANEFVDTLLDGRADGLILLAPRIDSLAMEQLVGQIPFVVTSDERRNAAHFGCDNSGGVRQAVDYLVKLGHRKIGHIAGDLGIADGQDRLRAFREALAAHEIAVQPAWIEEGYFTNAGGFRAGLKLLQLEHPPTAIFCANDESAVGLMRAAWDRGVRVPEDVSVIGFDNSPVSAAITPSITTVGQPLEQIGAAAMEAVVGYVETHQRPESRTFDTQLFIRKSTTFHEPL